MAKGLELKNTRVDELIAKIHLENPLWKAPKVHKEVLARLHDKNDPYYEPYLDDPDWPRKNTVYKHLKKIQGADKARPTESKELDKPWSIGALVKYPIPPESLPAVLRVFYAERRTDAATDEYFRRGQCYLTIRQVLWIARLSPLFKYPTLAVADSPKQDIAQYAKFDLVTAKLFQFARMYASEEMISEVLGKPPDTSNFDIGFYLHARNEIHPTLVSVPRLIGYSWENTQNQLKKEVQNER
ncbi:hypothetical protein ACFLVH_05900 [Chloroflexota bacterium]